MAFDPARYEEEVVKPLRGHRGRLPTGDLARRYAVESGMSREQLKEHLRRVRTYWNQRSGARDSRGQVCKLLLAADEELRRTAGEKLHDPDWWRAQQQQWQQRTRTVVDQLAADLAKAYQALGQITRAQLGAVAAHFAGLDQAHIDEAVRQAGLRVVEAVELPRTSGLNRTAYKDLTDRLSELDLPTIVPLLHPGLDKPFTLVQAFTVPGGPRLTLDRATVVAAIEAAETTADSPALRARKAALKVLRTGLSGGADLRQVALFQVVEQVADGRAQGVADLLLSRRAVELGLDRQDAELLVASLPSGGGGPRDAGTQIRDLLQEGRLREAQRALAALPVTDPQHDEVKALVEAAHATVEGLIQQAAQAVRDHREEDAERRLREATRIAGDDEDLAARLARLPLPPPREPSAVEDADGSVRLAWKAPDSGAAEVHYQVVRTEGRVATAADDGTPVAATKDTGAVDRRPPVARQLWYAVFARAGDGSWSRPATTSVLVTPGLSAVKVRAHTDHVVGSWTRHPGVVAVRVRRTADRPPRRPEEGVAVRADAESFTDRDVEQGREYYYSLVALYHGERQVEVAAPMVVASASPRAPARPVEALTVTPVSVDGDSVRIRIAWPTVDGGQTRIRYGERAPAWAAGSTVPVADMEAYGREVAGPRRADGAETVLEAEVAAGHHAYVPFTIGGTGAVVGRVVMMGVTEPVRQLTVRRIGAEAVVSWVWPAEVSLVEVAWKTPERSTDLRRITKAQYVSAGGCRLPVQAGGGIARVTAVVVGASGEASSPPVVVSVDGRSAALSYEIQRQPGVLAKLSRQRTLSVRVDADCADVELVVVAAPGLVMPLRPDQGTEVNRYAGLALVRDLSLTLPIAIPPDLRRPYWLRCFVVHPPHVSVVDPPIDNLKVT
ncbi:hypothetical protein [Phytohabitans rumicis]|uniref:Fibronectin type-III domain-containing protein n=1 Tax=Phytohabitans rumicis TaxID=1076125 RepID=A0A6V8KXK1_9ACTN|nr:hypothetical protein [Phytohabitans rumicis]GFJ86567.1 hypothetical protein Prum_002090 [Phytohabitans rumicis]